MLKKLKSNLESTGLLFRVSSIVIISILCVFLGTSLITVNISKNVLVDTFSKANHKILLQIIENLSSLNDNIINIMNIIDNNNNFEKYLTEEMNFKEEYKMLYNMVATLDAVPNKDYHDISVLILGTSGKTFIKGHNYFSFLEPEKLLDSDLIKNALEHEESIFYQFSEFPVVNSESTSTAITSIKVLRNDDNEVYGYVFVFISQADLRKYYLPFVGNSNNITLLSQDGTIVSSSRSYEIGDVDKNLLSISNEIQNNKLEYIDSKIKSRDVAILSDYLPTYNFNVVGIIDKNVILDEVYNTNKIFLFNILIAFIFLILTFIIIKQTTDPLSNLAYKMSQITRKNFENYVEIKGSSEVRELSNSFNSMLDDLNKYIIDTKQMEKEKRKAEIHALQMQINPHFLYNTLSSIKWLIWQGDIDKSTKTIDAFISLLRNTISNKNEMVTIKEEVENLKNYVFINHVRYGNNIQVNYFVDANCEDYIIPKLILQPFIENSFFHGFVDRTEGFIHVFINENDGKLICEIIDNGIGIPQDGIKTILKHCSNKSEHFTSIGVNNVNDRIKLLYGEEYGLKITSQVNCGTTVKIVIPALNSKE